METHLSILLSLPCLLVLVALQVRILLFRGDKNSSALDYLVPFLGNLRRTLVWSISRQKNGSIVGTCVKREPIGIMLSLIHRSGIDKWWEKNCYAFIWKEVKLRRKSVENTCESIFYWERSSDMYEIFWVKIMEEFFHWIKRLQEDPEFHGRAKKIYVWDTKNLAALQRLDCPVTWAMDF